VTIPEAMRRETGLLPGTEVEFIKKGKEVLLRRRGVAGGSKRARELREHLDRLRGSAQSGWTTEEIMRLTRGDD
jgi:bifunctional DNA-binding transcriptional regulator/antitoxin component of YhaV-PrlF toxin-antitoxin module